MEDFLTKLVSIIRGILTFIGVIFFGAAIYLFVIPNIWGIIIVVIFSILGFFLAKFVYITASRRGNLAMVTAYRSSPDLDNLEPSANSETRKLSPKEYVDNFVTSDLKFKGGSLRIWGDFKSRRLEENHIISDIKFINEATLLISFLTGNKLKIWNPKIIFDAPTFMKILRAERIVWEWNEQPHNKKYYYEYWVEGNNIRTRTDFDWKSYKIDTMLGDPAVFMYKT